MPLWAITAGKAILDFLRGLPLWVWLVVGAIVGVYVYGEAKEAKGERTVQVKFDKHLSADRGAEAVAKQRAQLREEQDRAAFAVIGATFDQEKSHAAEKGRSVAAGIRAGTVRLREQWTCPTGNLPGTAGSARAADAGAELRATDSGRLVRIGAEADAQVKGLQAVLAAERAKPIAR